MNVQDLRFTYEYITDKDKLAVVNEQLRQMESQHFSLVTSEPSKLQNQEQWQQWYSQISQWEQGIITLREYRSRNFNLEEE